MSVDLTHLWEFVKRHGLVLLVAYAVLRKLVLNRVQQTGEEELSFA